MPRLFRVLTWTATAKLIQWKSENKERRGSLTVKENLLAHGHINIKSTNKATFEFTKEQHLTPRGDCIVAVGANKGAFDLSADFKKIACQPNAFIEIKIMVDSEIETIKAKGHPALTFLHPTDLVVRKSDYVCGRTLAIRADKAAFDLSRRMVEKLRNPKQKAEITLTAKAKTT